MAYPYYLLVVDQEGRMSSTRARRVSAVAGGVDERMNGWKDDTQTVGKQRRLRGGTIDGWIDGRMAS